MKLVNRFCVVVVLLSVSLSCFAKKIDMEGEWYCKRRFIHLDIPVEASVDESSKRLYLQFQEDLGLVYVTVTNDSGEVVYHEAVETAEQICLEIQLDSVFNESYLFTVNDGSNNVQGIISF